MTALLILNACARVEILDHEFCADKGSLGAKCFHSLTTETRAIPKDQWDDERFGQICSSAATYADLKSAIEKLCSDSHACDWQVKQQIDLLFKRIEAEAPKAPPLN